jgi:hypothetical protein
MRRLSGHPQANKWRGMMRVGEFRSVVVEEWVDDPTLP